MARSSARVCSVGDSLHSASPSRGTGRFAQPCHPRRVVHDGWNAVRLDYLAGVVHQLSSALYRKVPLLAGWSGDS